MDLTLLELENVLMMIEFARKYGHYDHSYARNAEQKIRKVVGERKAELLDFGDEVEEVSWVVSAAVPTFE